jgi:hypothetical protein
LSLNPNAIHLLFTYDYSGMKEQMKSFTEELVRYVFHPSWLMRICYKYEIDLDDYVEIVG